MKVDDFWKIILEARNEGEGDCVRSAHAVQRTLEMLPAEEIASYNELFVGARGALATWDLKGVAYLCELGLNDGFDYFRNWIILQGPETFRRALEAPEDVGLGLDLDAELWCEHLLSAGLNAYETVTGRPSPVIDNSKAITEFGWAPGKEWESGADLQLRFPRLFAKVGGEALF
jgi:hypothetical protein